MASEIPACDLAWTLPDQRWGWGQRLGAERAPGHKTSLYNTNHVYKYNTNHVYLCIIQIMYISERREHLDREFALGYFDALVGLAWGLGFRVSGFGFRVSGFGFRVSGFGFRV